MSITDEQGQHVLEHNVLGGGTDAAVEGFFA
jgi:hypothetical protein